MKVFLMMMMLLAVSVVLTGCSSLENKAVGIGSGVDAFKIETSGSISSGTVLPNIIAGGAVNTLATAPVLKDGEKTQVVYVHTRRTSFFGEIFGIDAATESTSYIGAPNESAEDTAKRLAAFQQIGGEMKTEVKSE